MRPVRILVLGVAVALGASLVVGCSSDKKSSSSSSTTKTSGSGVTVTSSGKGTAVAVVVSDTKGTDAPETMTATPASAPAGPVTFTVNNTGTIKHEFVVVKTDGATLTVGSDGKVSEKGSVDEIGDIEPGKTESLTVTLEAGQYQLVCNIKDHYELGMHIPFTVT